MPLEWPYRKSGACASSGWPHVWEASGPETSLHGIPDEHHQGKIEFAGEGSQVRTAKQSGAASVARHHDDPLHHIGSVRDPEVEPHLLPLAFADALHGLAPLVVGEFPIPRAIDDLMVRRLAPRSLVERPVPAALSSVLRVLADPPDGVAFGQLQRLVQFDFGGTERNDRPRGDE